MWPPNWAEFSAALSAWCWPTLNVGYSDDQGHHRPTMPQDGFRYGLEASQVSPFRMPAHEWRGYIPFDDMPARSIRPRAFWPHANSRVTPAGSPYPLSLDWLAPYRAERIGKALQGRDRLTPADMLAVQTDVYSEVDQKLGRRFADAIDHTPGTDDRLRKAAALMRSWDGRLIHWLRPRLAGYPGSRRALALILEPKLAKEAAEYHWGESNFAEEEIIMHASADWLPAAFKNWDALLAEAVRKGMEDGKAPADVAPVELWELARRRCRAPAGRVPAAVGPHGRTGPQPLSGDDTTVKQVERAYGPSQRFTMDWSDVDGSTENIVLGESGNPLSPYFRDQWDDYYQGTTFALPFSATAVAAQTRHTLRLIP